MTQTAVNEAAHGAATAIPSQVQAEKTASQERVDHFVSDVMTAVREVMVRHDMSYDEYAVAKQRLIDVGEAGEWPLFLDVWFEPGLQPAADPAAALVGLFEARFDPALDGATRDIRHDELAMQITRMIDEVAGLDADRILRGLFALVRATLRTNYYIRDANGDRRHYLALKLDSNT